MKRIIATAILTLATASFALAADTLSLPAKNGNIAFPHKTHETLGCMKCHTTEKGGKIEGLNKDWAHKTCKGCHEEMKKGPIKCAECHKK